MNVALSAEVFGYLQRLALLHYGSLAAQYDDLLRKFIQVAPWTARPALGWMPAPRPGRCNTVAAQLALSDDLRALLEDTAAGQGVTPDDFAHTALVWWTTHVYPQRRFLVH